MPNRQVLLLSALAVVLCVVVIVKWFSGGDRVTLDFTNAPLSKVIKSIERQAHIEIATNADPNQLVTILLKRAPVYEAIDTLATRINGDARLAYVAAPDSAAIKEVLTAFTAGTNPGGWKSFAGGFGGGPMGGGGGAFDSSADPRLLEWKMSDVTDRSLQAILSQASQKTGATYAVPETWNPVLGKLPEKGTTRDMTKAMMSAAKGKFEEVFLVTVRPPRNDQAANNDGGQRWGGGQTVFSGGRGRDGMNPEWAAERAQAQIAQLPPEERPQAQQQFDMMRNFFASLRGLPEDERRAKMEEFFNKPEVQEAMDDRMAARDAKSTPQQREQRYRNYIQRKQAIKGAPAKS